MEELCGFVARLTNSERVGGRVQRVGLGQVVLRDCMHWPHHFTDAVHDHFPDVLIDVRGSRNSLTGFIVVFTLLEHAGGVRCTWFVVIALGLTACAYALVASPWWGGAYRSLWDV